jgi:L-asparagine transporter-like permease
MVQSKNANIFIQGIDKYGIGEHDMADKRLTIINILAALAAICVVVLFMVYVPREQFLWGVYLILLILIMVGYANVRQPLIDYIEARKKKKNTPPDPKGEQRLKIFNYAGLILVLVIGILCWLFMREQFTWAAILMVLVLLLMIVVNAGKIFSDIS